MKKFRTPPYNDEKKQTQLLTPGDEIIKIKIVKRTILHNHFLKNRSERLGFNNNSKIQKNWSS